MVTCVCGKTIEKLPSWLQGTKVDFVCNNCPNRQTKNIALVSAELDLKPSVKLDEEDELELDEAIEDELDA